MEKKSPSKKILVLEDDDSVRSFLVFSLRNEGFDVYEASTGEIALKKAQEIPPDLALLDVMLPKMDGFKVCAQMRTLSGLQNTPVIFVTAYGKEDLIARAREAGGNGVIEKPVMFDELYMQVLEALDGKFSLPTRLRGKNIEESSS